MTTRTGPDPSDHGVDADQARDQLQRAAALEIDSTRDREVYGVATMVFGAVIGIYMAVQEALDGKDPWDDLTTVGYAVLLVGLAWWQTRTVRTVPRNARTTGRVGAVATLVLAMAAVMGMNAWGHTVRVPPAVLVLVAAVIASPMLVAGQLIRTGGRR
jgi:hypothetical protein